MSGYIGVGTKSISFVTEAAPTAAKGGGTDKVFYENDNTITTDYDLTASQNTMSAGPITINSGVTVNIPTGARWVVV